MQTRGMDLVGRDENGDRDEMGSAIENEQIESVVECGLGKTRDACPDALISILV